MYLIWIFGSKLLRSNHQSRATLFGLETRLSERLLPFVIILITSSLSSKTYNKTSWREEMTFEGIKSTLSKSLIIPWDCFRFWIVWGVERTSRFFINGSPRSLWLWFVFPRTATIRSHKSNAVIPFNLNPASKEMVSDSVELCETEVCFSHIQLIGTNIWLPNMQCSSRSGFWILKISCKSRVLKQSQSALFSNVTHIAILFVFTCVMNVWNQSNQAFVTSFGSFCNRSCKFIHWP